MCLTRMDLHQCHPWQGCSHCLNRRCYRSIFMTLERAANNPLSLPSKLAHEEIARINPIRFSKAATFDFDEVLTKMTSGAKKFNVDKINQKQLASMGDHLQPRNKLADSGRCNGRLSLLSQRRGARTQCNWLPLHPCASVPKITRLGSLLFG